MKKKHLLGLLACAAMVTGYFYFSGKAAAQKSDATVKDSRSQLAPENNTPQTLPFSQAWTNTGLITTNDDWSGVPGIQGFLGQDIVTGTGVDPRTILTPASSLANDLDVIANQTNPDTLASGGVAEFEIANPSIALNGSGTADVPHIILYLNTTGQSNIRVQYNARDLDGSADNSIQQINTQYRVGNTGNFINVPGGYIADASTGPSQATLVTPVDVTLPAAANNQPEVQVRIMSTNAVGNDEWIGIDDINVTTTANPARSRATVDFNGDLRTDFAVFRAASASAQGHWFISLNGTGAMMGGPWGLGSDFIVSEDFDGDNRSDITVWRPGPANAAAFYILQSQTNTVRIEVFGQNGDDPTVVGDYDGDGKADPAVYRQGASPGQQSTWFYRGSLNNPTGGISNAQWGLSNDFPAPGDYDGDGKNDFVIQRGPSPAKFWRLLSTGGIDVVSFGLSTDVIVPGDYDGDGKTDIAVVRGSGGAILWHILQSSNGAYIGPLTFGLSATDLPTPGDYDGDGKTDIAIWRNGVFWVQTTASGISVVPYGQNGDFPVANYNTH